MIKEDQIRTADREEIASWLERTGVHEIADELNRSGTDFRLRAFGMLAEPRAREIFSLLDPSAQSEILAGLDEERRQRLLDDMEPDDRARLVENLPENEQRRILDELDPDERRLTELLLAFPPDSAGRMMSPEFVRLPPELTVEQALDHIRASAAEAETVHFFPVAASDMKLLGTLDLPRLVLARPEQRVAELVSREVPVIPARRDQEDVARLMKESDLMAVPVVDENGRLVGIITHDDAMEVLEYEASEDIARTGAAEPIARPYLSTSTFRLVRARIIWLCVLAVAATLTVNVLSAFEATLDQVVSLALFIPLLIGIGGNAGAQSATTIVRALAVRDVTPSDALRIAFKEMRTALLMGAALAVAGYLIVLVFFGSDIALIVSLTMVAVCALGALTGSMMPIIARLISVDPAVFSAPFVTTIVDATGLLVYFFIAKLVLGI